MSTSSPYFERYCKGEHEAVCRELIALGSQIREEPILSDALAVAHEIVRRARVNLHILHRRLMDMGYEFEDPRNALVDAGTEAIELVRTSQAKLGTFPLLLQVWYENIASVDFTQASKQRHCADREPPAAPDIFGLGSHPVLVFQRIDDCWETWQENRNQYFQTRANIIKLHGDDVCWPESYAPYLTTGEFAGNCEPKGVRLPDYAFDAVLYNEGDGDVYFLDELRLAFQWGGFPFWRLTLLPPHELERIMGMTTFGLPFEHRPNFKKLLPVLKVGLLPL